LYFDEFIQLIKECPVSKVTMFYSNNSTSRCYWNMANPNWECNSLARLTTRCTYCFTVSQHHINDNTLLYTILYTIYYVLHYYYRWLNTVYQRFNRSYQHCKLYLKACQYFKTKKNHWRRKP